MKAAYFMIGMMLLAGCGADDARQAERRVVYPALDESPPPQAPAADASEQPVAKTDDPPAEIVREGWVQRQVQKAEQVKQLREYAAKAEPDDPFAMTEKEIEAFSKRENSESF